MDTDDKVFWERLADMPFWEAEQELVLRREHNQLQLGVLASARAALVGNLTKAAKREAAELGAAMAGIHQQMTLINERLKYLRKLQERIHWRAAVKATLGDEAALACSIWIEQQWAEVYDARRKWAR